MDIDTLAEKVEKLTIKINSLNYPFVDADIQTEAVEALNEANALLENYVDLATRDAEENSSDDEENP